MEEGLGGGFEMMERVGRWGAGILGVGWMDEWRRLFGLGKGRKSSRVGWSGGLDGWVGRKGFYRGSFITRNRDPRSFSPPISHLHPSPLSYRQSSFCSAFLLPPSSFLRHFLSNFSSSTTTYITIYFIFIVYKPPFSFFFLARERVRETERWGSSVLGGRVVSEVSR